MSSFTIGCDPEVFVQRNGKAISAHGLIPGSKKEPFPTANGAVQVDGLALELNTTPVDLDDFQGFNTNVVKQIACLRDMVNEGKEPKDRINLALRPVMDFDQEVLDAAPEEAKELGCDPDFSAYTMEANPRPNGTVNFRTGAGHIHIGWGADIPVENKQHMEICAGFIKALDCTVGLFMTVIDREPRRRDLYGKAGAFRPKSYGVEYRTPSNVWIKNAATRELVHYLVKKAVDWHSRGYKPSQLFTNAYNANKTSIVPKPDQAEVQRIIDEGDHEKALIFVDQLLNSHKTWTSYKDKLLTEAVRLAA